MLHSRQIPMFTLRRYRWVVLLLAALLLGACGGIVRKATQKFADNLSTAILESDDPATVHDGVPSFLLLTDALILNDPQNPGALFAGAQLYGAYAGGFAGDAARGHRLAARAYDYARRGTCLRRKDLCDVLAKPFDDFAPVVANVGKADIDVLYALGSAWAGRIQANSDDWNAIADIPKVQAIFDRVVALDESYEAGQPFMVLGVLHSLRPANLGGTPDKGKASFERAIALSNGKNLMAKTLYAQYYARLVFDQELHDRLLKEVLAAAPEAPRLTLVNTLAQARAKALLDSSKDYF